METMGDRLRWARQKAGYPSARQAAIKHGWTGSTYAAHENGQNEFDERTAKLYGKVFRRSPGWLLTGVGDSGVRKTSLVGRVGAGAEIIPIDQDESEEIDLPPGASPAAVAVRIEGDSMAPRYFPGEKLFYVRDDVSPSELVGKECVVRLKDGRMLVKILRKGSKPRSFNLESWNAPTMKDQAIEWAAAVRWTERG
jgi:phage repressor protein C with HTH and peptisase S24 domain